MTSSLPGWVWYTNTKSDGPVSNLHMRPDLYWPFNPSPTPSKRRAGRRSVLWILFVGRINNRNALHEQSNRRRSIHVVPHHFIPAPPSTLERHPVPCSEPVRGYWDPVVLEHEVQHATATTTRIASRSMKIISSPHRS